MMELRRFESVRLKFGIRYFLAPVDQDRPNPLGDPPIVYEDRQMRIYDLQGPAE